jgi:hypothetical protein
VIVSGPDVNLYADVLQQIKVRLDEADQLLVTCPTNWSAELVLERTALHLRKVIELIVLSTLVTNRAELESVSHKIHKQDADGARKLIRRVNPDYWPEPIRTTLTGPGRNFEILPVTDSHLSEIEWGKAFGWTSNILHARNPLADPFDVHGNRERLEVLTRKVRTLLTEHRVHLVGGDTTVLGKLDRGDGVVSTGLFERQM